MSILRKARVAMGMKLLKSEMRFGGNPLMFFGDFNFPRPDLEEMAEEVGDGTSADVVMTPIRWLQRAFMESEIAVMEQDGEIVEDHDLPALVENPNPFYAAEHLFAGTLFSLSTDGNAYWIKVRDGARRIVELWYVPHFMIDPKWPDSGRVFIDHYEYQVQGETIPLKIEDVVHFRDGLDPNNIRKGLSPLKGLLREVWTDREAAMFTAAMLKNGGIPGVVITPKDDVEIEPGAAEQTKGKFREEFGRERRGNVMVTTVPMDVNTFGFNPRELDLSFLRDVSEERVTAALGVPAAVVGFGAGLQQTKVGATMRELRRLAWDNGIIPLQRIIAGSVKRQLLPEFDGNDRRTVRFDNSEVSALQEDEAERDKRVTELVNGGIWTRGEGRAATGQEATDADDVFLIPISMIEIPRTGMPDIEPPPSNEPPDDDPEERARQALHSKSFKRHDPLEEQVAANARRAAPSQRVRRFAQVVDVIRRSQATRFESELFSFFDRLGIEAQAAARFLAEERSARGAETKRETMIAARIIDGLNLLGQERALRTLYQRHYLGVGEAAGKALADFIGLPVGFPDPAARAMLATGGRRAGLIDLSAKTKRIIFDSLVEGRIEGLAGENLARFIRANVARGPWSSPTVRARVIARTEVAFATNTAVIESARSIGGLEKMMIHDARAGDTDETCEAIDGRIVTLEEAEQLAAAEHPNGTRSFTPLTPQLIEEMQ